MLGIDMHDIRRWILIVLLVSSPSFADSPLTPAEDADELQDAKDMARITLASTGQTVSVVETGKFYIYLDDASYPVSKLSLVCTPKSTGSISPDWRGIYRGPNRYPIAFYASAPGSCTLTDGDFSTTIVVTALN